MKELVEPMAKALFEDHWPKDKWARFKRGDLVHDLYSSLTHAALRAITDAGYAIVPVEPTPDMLDAASESEWTPIEIWRAMLAAAPKMEG